MLRVLNVKIPITNLQRTHLYITITLGTKRKRSLDNFSLFQQYNINNNPVYEGRNEITSRTVYYFT